MAENPKLQSKIIIECKLKCITGLHIGATQDSVEIGGMDNAVIRDPLTYRPYIPGSSLKGKLRSLSEWKHGAFHHDSKRGNLPSRDLSLPPAQLFGVPAEADTTPHPTMLTVRDSMMDDMIAEALARSSHLLTEVKSENSLDRITSEAVPRSMERVLAGAQFNVSMILDIYDSCKLSKDKALEELRSVMALLEDSGLGGGVSRGSGRVRFVDIRILERTMPYYEGDASAETSTPFDNLQAWAKAGTN